MIFTQNSNSFYFWILNLKGAKPLSSRFRHRKPHATLIIHEDSLRRIRPRFFNILLDWQQVEVTISYISKSFQFAHLTFLLFSASAFLFGLNRSWSRSLNISNVPDFELRDQVRIDYCCYFNPIFRLRWRRPGLYRFLVGLLSLAVCRFPRFEIRFEIDQARLFQFLLLLNFTLLLYINIVQIFFVSA